MEPAVSTVHKAPFLPVRQGLGGGGRKVFDTLVQSHAFHSHWDVHVSASLFSPVYRFSRNEPVLFTD